MDFDRNKIFYPPEICATSQRPDIVIWSAKFECFLNIELTCPAEEGIEPAQLCKEVRYFDLKCAAKGRQWASKVMTIEVGARGFIARTLPRLLKSLGRGLGHISMDTKNTSNIVARCFPAIYLARDCIGWDMKHELLATEEASM